MIDKFLKAKHWQLFVLIFGIPMACHLTLMAVMFANIFSGKQSDPFFMLNTMKFVPVVIALFVAFQFGWFWSMAVGLQSKVPAHVTMKVRKFKIFFFIPLVYFTFIMLLMAFAFENMATIGQEPNVGLIAGLFIIIIPLHFFSIFCILYCLYFVAKTFKTVELQREVQFSDFMGEFFMIWFYPIGVWVIQPKVNRMVGG